MEIAKKKMEADSNDRVVISALSVKCICIFLVPSLILFVLSVAMGQHYLDQFVGQKYSLTDTTINLFGEIIFGVGSVCGIILLLRRTFLDSAAIYIENGSLFYVNPFVKYIRVSIEDIAEVKLAIYNNMIAIITNKGPVISRTKYIFTSITDSNPTETVKKISDAIKNNLNRSY